MESLEQQEYGSLRAAIRERGTLRVTVFVLTLAGWALAAVLVAALLVQPLAAIVPLLVLVAGFEAMHALHVGAERIGRYLLVRYEQGQPMWETAIGRFGRRRMPAIGRPSGAHFALVFTLAVATNLLVLGLASLPVELAALAVIHAIAIIRIVAAHYAAASQRVNDEARFREILAASREG